MFLMENKTSLRGERRINKGGIFVWCGDGTGYFSLVQDTVLDPGGSSVVYN